VLEYWHMGETTIRLRSVRSRILSSSNNIDLLFLISAEDLAARH
jgi:hypothetical protein